MTTTFTTTTTIAKPSTVNPLGPWFQLQATLWVRLDFRAGKSPLHCKDTSCYSIFKLGRTTLKPTTLPSRCRIRRILSDMVSGFGFMGL